MREQGAVHPPDRFAVDSVTIEDFITPGLGGVHLPGCAVPAMAVHIHSQLRACFAIGVKADEGVVGATKPHCADGLLGEGGESSPVRVVAGGECGVFLACACVHDEFNVNSDDEETGERQCPAHGRGAAVDVYCALPHCPWGDGEVRWPEDASIV